MKKTAAILLALGLLLGVCAGCGDRSASGGAPKEDPSSGSEIASTPAAPPKAEGNAAPEPEAADDPDPVSPEESAPDSLSQAPEDVPEQDPLYFRLGPDGEAKALRAGDALGGWTLESYTARLREGTDGVPDVDGANFTAPDDAPVVLRGTIYLNPMGGADERGYWFDLAEEDYDKMPVLEGTDGRNWFRSLDNAALGALEEMGYEDRWDCRIAVRRYIYYHLPMGAINGAEIIRIELDQ